MISTCAHKYNNTYPIPPSLFKLCELTYNQYFNKRKKFQFMLQDISFLFNPVNTCNAMKTIEISFMTSRGAATVQSIATRLFVVRFPTTAIRFYFVQNLRPGLMPTQPERGVIQNIPNRHTAHVHSATCNLAH
jgi:hypothetical protein